MRYCHITCANSECLSALTAFSAFYSNKMAKNEHADMHKTIECHEYMTNKTKTKILNATQVSGQQTKCRQYYLF